ncbi:MAG: hypothetical protein ACFFAZ_10250 [Promethearchaeota archaeon]
MRENRLRAIAMAIGLFIILTLPAFVQAELVWSDSFDDGTIPEEWTTNGMCCADDHCLRGTEEFAKAWKESSIESGTWKFDVIDIDEWTIQPDPIRTPSLNVRFMGTDPDVSPATYYEISIGFAVIEDIEKYTYTLTKKSEDDQMAATLVSYDGTLESSAGTVHHLAVTRTAGGQMSVFLNGSLTPILQASDNELATAEYFYVEFWHDFAVDNIEVYDTIEVGELPIVWIAIGAGGVLAVVVIVVYLKRR